MKNYLLLLFALTLAVGSCTKDDPRPTEPTEPTEPPQPMLNKSDSLALVDIWLKGDGENWDVKWDLDSLMTWGGVVSALDEKNNEYRVVSLSIISHQGNGYLSEAIGDLQYLRVLYIGGEGFSGRIPRSIEKLAHLNEFEIIGTLMRDTIPKEVFTNPYIKYISISSNKYITGSLPAEVANLLPLDENIPRGMVFTYNNMSGKIPKDIKIGFDLRWNDFTEYPYEYCAEDKPWIRMEYNKIDVTPPDWVKNDADAYYKMKSVTYWQHREQKY